MATTKSYNYILTSPKAITHTLNQSSSHNCGFLTTNRSQYELEFNESEIWDDNASETRSNSQDPRSQWKRRQIPATPARPKTSACASSLPVNIPDWSKILRGEYKGDEKWDCFNGGVDDYDDDYDEWVPPHEYLARTRMASFSVHEGVGRTLKGRDLSRVRNAIWEITGFQD